MSDTTPIQYDAFISYARADGRDLAERLYVALKDRGFRPWRDERDLNPHQDFSVGIERAIRASRYLVVLLTPSIAERDDSFVRREILYAQGHKKPIIPLICPDFDSVDVPILINHLTWLSFVDFEAGFSTLLERVHANHETYLPPTLIDDPFRAHLERLRDFVVSELETSLLNIDDMLLLSGKDTPSAVLGRVLTTAYRSRVLAINQLSVPPDLIFANFNDGFAYHYGRVLLLGEPGAGKTTTLLAFAREKIYERLANPSAPLPIYAPLTSWDGKCEIADWLADATGINVVALHREIADKRVLFIFDGLDEMTVERSDSFEENSKSRDFRLEFFKKLKPLEISTLVSCRHKDYHDIMAKGGEKISLSGAMSLQPLSNEQIKAYLKPQPELWDTLQGDVVLLEMARTPLLLTLLTIGYRDSTPIERAQLRNLSASSRELRDRIFETFVQKRYTHEQLRSPEPLAFTLERMYALLGHIAMVALSRTTFNPIGDPITNNIEFYLGDQSKTFIDQAIRLHFLFGSYGNLKFAHLLLQDYFAFRYSLHCLNHEDDGYREMAAIALNLIGDVRATEALLKTLKDDNKLVRIQAVYALGNLKDLHSVTQIVELLDNDQWSQMKSACCSALGNIGDSFAVESLLTALNNSSENVRYSAANALGRIKDTRAVEPHLIAMLSDPEIRVRSIAAVALGSIGDLRAITPLIGSLSDWHGNMRISAAYAIAQIGIPAIEPLIDALSNPNENVRNSAVIALVHIGKPAVDALNKQLSNTTQVNHWNKARVCDYASRALEYINTQETIPAIDESKRGQENI